MSALKKPVRIGSVLSASVLIVMTFSGCGKTGPAARRALGRTEQTVAKNETAMARGLREGNKVAANRENKLAKDLMEAGADLAGNYIQDQAKGLQGRQNGPGNGPLLMPPVGQRFPFPLSSIQPTPGSEFLYDEQLDQYARANNYGGFIYYDGAGLPIGFSARTRSGEFHHFDQRGYRR